jgi:hypothetical protein
MTTFNIDNKTIRIDENGSSNILELDQVCTITQEVYFQIVDHFGIAKKCIEHDPENQDGTRNTEYGEELYNLIEYAVKNAIDFQD